MLEVSVSAFYFWLQQGARTIAKSREKQTIRIKEIFTQKKRRYGSKRIFRQLREEGVNICRSTVESIMRECSLVAKGKKRFKKTTHSGHGTPVAPNLLDRQFDVSKVDSIWLSDITYLPLLNGGFLYLCVIMDLASRKVIGWYVDTHMEVSIVYSALISAVINRGHVARGIIFHSDQGSQYGAKGFLELLSLYGFIQSMSRRAQCWDNAPMESFFDSLKTEYPECLKFKGLKSARLGLFEYIEIFYNRERMHSAIDYQRPSSYEPLDGR